MTQPTPGPTPNQQQLRSGAVITLDTLKRFPSVVREASEERVSYSIPGTEHLDQLLAQVGANEAHLVFTFSSVVIPADFSVQVFVNVPNASAATQATAGFVGAVAFFQHPGHPPPTFRLPLTTVLQQTSALGGTEITATFVPVAFPGRPSTPHVLSVTVSLDLVLSKVEPVS